MVLAMAFGAIPVIGTAVATPSSTAVSVECNALACHCDKAKTNCLKSASCSATCSSAVGVDLTLARFEPAATDIATGESSDALRALSLSPLRRPPRV